MSQPMEVSKNLSASTTPEKSLTLGERWYLDKRVGGLLRFAVSISLLNILGHAWLGFEQSWITPFVALAAAYFTELAAEYVQSRADGRTPAFAGGLSNLVIFLLPAHISGLAVSMLVFVSEQYWIIAFGASISVASKWMFKVPMRMPNGKVINRHFLNPSNFGISVVLLLFPTVGIAPAYMFTESIWGIGDWLVTILIFAIGGMFNLKFTGRWPLIATWLLAFAFFGIVRSWINDASTIANLIPMTGFAFVLFTFYMITDPGTTPAKRNSQIFFALSVALIYNLFMHYHLVYGLFYSLTIVTLTRGLWCMLISTSLWQRFSWSSTG